MREEIETNCINLYIKEGKIVMISIKTSFLSFKRGCKLGNFQSAIVSFSFFFARVGYKKSFLSIGYNQNYRWIKLKKIFAGYINMCLECPSELQQIGWILWKLSFILSQKPGYLYKMSLSFMTSVCLLVWSSFLVTSATWIFDVLQLC